MSRALAEAAVKGHGLPGWGGRLGLAASAYARLNLVDCMMTTVSVTIFHDRAALVDRAIDSALSPCFSSAKERARAHHQMNG